MHGLEAPLERGVLLDVLAVLVERGGADRAQLAAREHRLEQVRGVHRALGRAGADDRVQLVHEQDHLALGVGDLLEHGLEPVLELAAVLRAGDQGADVERDHAPVAERLGHVAGHDPLGQPLDDRRLAHARLADQDGVVLGAPRQHLDHAPDLLVAADHRVELALLGGLGEVAAEALERLVALLGVLVGHAVRAAHLLDRLRQLVARGAGVHLRVARQREQQVLGGHVLVAHPARLVVGAACSRSIRSLPSAGAAPASPVTVGSASSASFAELAHALGVRRPRGAGPAPRCRPPARAGRRGGGAAPPRGCGARRPAAERLPGPPET